MIRTDLSTYVEARVPLLLWGPPGVGKTQKWLRTARDLRRPIHVLIASIRDPTDFYGFPHPNVERRCVEYLPPNWARELGKHGIIFLDELSSARPAVQDALLRIIIDRVVGDFQLPDDVYVCAAANPPEQTASGFSLSLPLQNRFVHVEYKPSVEEFGQQFPTLWSADVVCPHRTKIAGFIGHSPSFLLVVPKQQDLVSSYAWPSPRSWEMAAKLLRTSNGQADIAPAVGADAASAFVAWQAKLRVPSAEELLTGARWPRLPWEILVAANNILHYTEERRPQLEQRTWASTLRVLANAPAKDLVINPVGKILGWRHKNWAIPDEVLAIARVLDLTAE